MVLRLTLLLAVLTGCGAALDVRELDEPVYANHSAAQTTPQLIETSVAPPMAIFPGSFSRVLKDTTTAVALELNASTVFCTGSGYAGVMLKISIPDLDWLAHFDHRVEGTTLPCATGGACTADFDATTLLQGGAGIEVVPVRVILSETLSVDLNARTCERLLSEHVTTTIRGHTFVHHAADATPTQVPFSQCLAIARTRSP